MPGTEQDRRHRHAPGRQCLRGAAAAQLAGDQAGTQHGEGRRERRRQAQPDQRSAEQGVGGVGEQRAQRGLVHVAERRLPARAQEVQLVAVVAVAPGHGQQKQDDAACQTGQRRPGDAEASQPRRRRRYLGATAAVAHFSRSRRL